MEHCSGTTGALLCDDWNSAFKQLEQSFRTARAMSCVSKRITLSVPTQFSSITERMNLASKNMLLSLKNVLVTPTFCKLIGLFTANPLQNKIGILFSATLICEPNRGKSIENSGFRMIFRPFRTKCGCVFSLLRGSTS